MSTFGRMLIGAAKSNTVQFNSIFLAIWSMIADSEFINSNPEYQAVVAGIVAIANIFLRFKTKAPLVDR